MSRSWQKSVKRHYSQRSRKNWHFELLQILTANVCSVYMAASRRSPLTRGQWRSEDSVRSTRDRREREPSDHRTRSPTRTRRREGSSDVGPRIKGRATENHGRRGTSKHRERSRSPARLRHRVSSRSPRRRPIGEGSKRTRELSEERHIKRSRYRDSSPPSSSRKHLRSISPHRRTRHSEYERRRRSPSPQYTDRGVTLSDRRPERLDSQLKSSRREQFHHTRDRVSDPAERSAGDSYVPSSRRDHARSPESREKYRPTPSRRHSPSPPLRPSRRDQYSTKYQEPRRPSHDKHRKLSSEHKIRKHRSRETSPSKGAAEISRSSKQPEKTRSRTLNNSTTRPEEYYRSRQSSPHSRRDRNEGTNMQSSTHPIQSILDDQPRQPSPPRPIPSFDDSTGSADAHMREAFPMHGMKSNDMHSNHRRGPGHIDTRQPYATSPQFMTPTSSHHGSPQSGSPYSHGRGGWGGQHFQGQTG